MNIFIFHRDLRLQDSTSLIAQIKEFGNVVPIFILTPEQIGKSTDFYNSNSIQFMCESLNDLSKNINKKNGKMYFFKGDNIKVLESIHKNNPINSISFNIDYTPYARKRDLDIKTFCDSHNINCIMKEDYLLYDLLNGQTNKADGTEYSVFTPFKNHCMKNLKVRKPDTFKTFKFKKVKELEDNNYYVDEKHLDTMYTFNEHLVVNGGRNNAKKILKNIKEWKDYNKCRDFFTYKTTHLSAHNHFTTISIRELYWTILEKLGKDNNIISELHWRDFFSNMVYHNQHMLRNQISKNKNKTFKEKYNHINWKYNKDLQKRWEDGNLGIPMVDACMRELNKTGYMFGRGRMIVSSYLTKNLLHSWHEGDKYFARKLVDYSPMMNVGNWCWQIGGVDSQQFLRIFNPYIQSKKFDSECKYIKKWIPELENVPPKDIHNWPETCNLHIKNGCTYIAPASDYAKSRIEGLNELKHINKL